MSEVGAVAVTPAIAIQRRGIARFIRRNPTICLGLLVIATMLVATITAPLYAGDPLTMDPSRRLQGPSAKLWFGTDHLGHDVFARTVYGARVSLLVGFSVAVLAVAGGLVIGLIAGYRRRIDGVVMRVMDGLMS